MRPEPAPPPDAQALALRRAHQRAGWTLLAVFLVLGLGLELLHAWKVAWYLGVADETRRLMFTLAHAHGTLVGLLHLAFAASAPAFLPRALRSMRAASRLLLFGGVLLPLGFLLGGFFVRAGDPGLGVLLVPFGALALIAAVGACAAAAWRS